MAGSVVNRSVVVLINIYAWFTVKCFPVRHYANPKTVAATNIPRHLHAMKAIFVISDNIISPLGNTTADNFTKIINGCSSVRQHPAGAKSSVPVYASLFATQFWQQYDIPAFTHFEILLIHSIREILLKTGFKPNDGSTGLIISSTKGNIGLIEQNNLSHQLKQDISLCASAKKIAAHFGFTHPPVIVSHACISGLVALITAQRMLQAGRFNNIIIAGADVITKFILSGFQSFQAISDAPCAPFDAHRKGINLGEAAASIALSVNAPSSTNTITLAGGAISNDANHISRPSPTGQELRAAIDNSIHEADITYSDIDFISLHGTATLYNDDMESKALHLAQLHTIPANSLKGYYGHTLGVAGLVESVISITSLKENIILPTKGFSVIGTVKNINVCTTLQRTPLTTCLKTASGFGGCNAAVVWKKV